LHYFPAEKKNCFNAGDTDDKELTAQFSHMTVV